MASSSLAVLAGQIETDAIDAWDELAGLMAAELAEESLGKMHQTFVGHQKGLHTQLRGPAPPSIETELDKIEQGVAGLIERINVLRTVLKPVWVRRKKAADDSLDALPIETIEKLERRRTELMEALRKLASKAKDLRRALDDPPAISADPVNGDDDNREAI